MHFGAPFGIEFSTFSRNGKNAFGAYSFTDSMVFDQQKPLIFQSKNYFSMFFQKRSKNQFLDVKGADRWSKVRFGSHFGNKGVAQNDPWKTTFRPKDGPKGYPANDPERPGADLGAIWRRKRSKDVFFSIGDRFWLFLEGFWTNLG